MQSPRHTEQLYSHVEMMAATNRHDHRVAKTSVGLCTPNLNARIYRADVPNAEPGGGRVCGAAQRRGS
jgi:hypothetical protein